MTEEEATAKAHKIASGIIEVLDFARFHDSNWVIPVDLAVAAADVKEVYAWQYKQGMYATR